MAFTIGGKPTTRARLFRRRIRPLGSVLMSMDGSVEQLCVVAELLGLRLVLGISNIALKLLRELTHLSQFRTENRKRFQASRRTRCGRGGSVRANKGCDRVRQLALRAARHGR